MQYEVIIGLEIHAQLKTQTKMFCADSTDHSEIPNSRTCPICLGMPGTLPTINKQAVEYAIRAALAFNCKINNTSVFARKNYFYPDLPKGYQISQYDKPLAEGGYIDLPHENGSKRIDLERIHLEEDAGKSIHNNGDTTLLNYNRCGVPLIEIVSMPQLSSGQEAVQYLKKIRQTLIYLDVCDGNMELGNFRCDANISVRVAGQAELGAKVELKNINSFRFVKKGIDFEIRRQTKLLENGQTVQIQTRLFDSKTGQTYAMRNKEQSSDYRYFPEPDLLPLVIEDNFIAEIKTSLPELPEQKYTRFIENYKLSKNQATMLMENRQCAGYFESCVAMGADPIILANWIQGPVANYANVNNIEIANFPISAPRLAGLIQCLEQKKITRVSAKAIMEKMLKNYMTAQQILDVNPQYSLSGDTEKLQKLITHVMENSSDLIYKYHNGNKKVFGAIMGRIMQETKGQSDPEVISRILQQKLDD